MSATMKAVAALERGRLGIVEVPRPIPGDYECLTQIAYCGICNGTDLKLLNDRVTDKQIAYPAILGHESVGRIVSVGKRVRYWRVGDPVVSPVGTIDPSSGFSCAYGQMAEYGITHDIQAMMEDGVALGAQPPLPDYRGKRIPDGMRLRDAVMLLTFKENYSALQNFGFKPCMNVLVCGDGPVAMGIARIARAMGAADIACVGHHDDRLEHIAACVPDIIAVNAYNPSALKALEGHKLDMIVDAVGDLNAVRELAPLLKHGGLIGLYGVLSKGRADLNLFDLPNDVRLHILNWPYGEHRVHEEVVDLVRRDILVPSDYYSHVIPIEDVQRGFDLIANRKAFKVILQMPGTQEV